MNLINRKVPYFLEAFPECGSLRISTPPQFRRDVKPTVLMNRTSFPASAFVAAEMEENFNSKGVIAPRQFISGDFGKGIFIIHRIHITSSVKHFIKSDLILTGEI